MSGISEATPLILRLPHSLEQFSSCEDDYIFEVSSMLWMARSPSRRVSQLNLCLLCGAVFFVRATHLALTSNLYVRKCSRYERLRYYSIGALAIRNKEWCNSVANGCAEARLLDGVWCINN